MSRCVVQNDCFALVKVKITVGVHIITHYHVFSSISFATELSLMVHQDKSEYLVKRLNKVTSN